MGWICSLIRKALTRTVVRRVGRGGKKVVRVQVLPSEGVVWGVCFVVVALVGLFVLEVVHLLVLRCWSSEVFAVITSLVGAVVGVFFGHG